MGVLDELVRDNEFPIIFIGAGLSKGYLVNYPSWIELLEKVWEEIGEKNFYSVLNSISDDVGKKEIDEKKKEFYTNIKIASLIENRIREKYNSGELQIKDLTPKDVYFKKINLLKKYLSSIFDEYVVKEEKNEEIQEFQNMLKKSRTILTTNYDCFIEDNFEVKDREFLKKYIGQKGLFRSENMHCELYKIHGCSKEPNSIVITEDDYKSYSKNSILITSKIISSLLNSPIIFFGYSLTDLNIRDIIKNFSNSLDENEKNRLSKKMIIINWKEGENKFLEETVTDESLNCTFTIIKTDNYLEVYKKIAKINQGATPIEISKFEHIIKELIIQKGKKGELDKTIVNLIPKHGLEEFLKDIGNKNIAVAVGDKAIIVKSLSTLDYLEEYMGEEIATNIEVKLRFLAQQNIGAVFPALKYLTIDNIENSTLLNNEVEKLEKCLEKLKEFNIKNSCHKEKIEFKTIKEVIDYANLRKESRKLKVSLEDLSDSLINSNITNFSKEDLKNYILGKLKIMNKENIVEISTNFRKLLINYDFVYNNISE